MRKHALLVGVEDYRDKMISRLNFARPDATALAERLLDRCGFDHVRVLADENGDDEPLLVNIITALRDTSAELRPDDLFLFFFAGHGVEKDGHGYLLARDSLQAFPEHGSLSLELLRKTFEHLSVSKRVLLLDACRNSPEAGRSDADNRMGDVISRDIIAAARSKLTGGTTTALLSACRSGQRAYEWPGKGHGVFTQYLIEGLDGAAWTHDELEFDHLAGYAARQVRQWAANTPGLPIPQEPWYEKFGDPDSILLAVGQSTAPVVRAKSASSPSKPKPSATKSVARWWVVVGGQERGPLDDAAMREGIRDGSIHRETECWREGMDRWQLVAETQQWAHQLTSSPDRPPRPPKRAPALHTLPHEQGPCTKTTEAASCKHDTQAHSKYELVGGRVPCPHCDEEFYTEDMESVECPECGESFTLDENRSAAGVKVTCPHCNEEFYTEGTGSVKCPECDESFTLGEDGGPVGSQVTCPYCDDAFYADDPGSVECPGCGESFTLGKDGGPEGSQVTCPYCDDAFYAEGTGSVECPECGESFTLGKDGGPVGSQVTCPYCDDAFYAEGTGSVECPECGESFTLGKDGGPVGSQVTCPYCDDAFYAEGTGSVECPECGESFTLDGNRSAVGLKVTCPHCDEEFYTEEIGKVACPRCDGEFTMKQRTKY